MPPIVRGPCFRTSLIKTAFGQKKKEPWKEQKKFEILNDIIKRLAKNGLINKHKASDIIKKKSPKKKKKTKGPPSPSSSYSSSGSSSSFNSLSDRDSESSSSDAATARKRSQRRRSLRMTTGPLPQLRASHKKKKTFRNSRRNWMSPTEP